jgi:CheY-like chemotaxis protein
MTPSLPESLAAPILVVEDSDEDFDTLRDAAAAAGVTRTMVRVASGGDCLAMLRGEGDAVLPQLPALILMDLNSHGVDGREALVAIKTDDSLKEIPMVVLTTSANPKDVAFCFQAGANAYHVKPVRHDEYLKLLGALLHYWLVNVTPRATTVRVD